MEVWHTSKPGAVSGADGAELNASRKSPRRGIAARAGFSWKAPAVLFGVLALAVVLALTGLLLKEARVQQEAAQNTLSALVEAKVAQLDVWLAGRRAVATSYGGARAIRDQAASLVSRNDADVRANLAARIEDIRHRLGIDAVLLLDSGAQILSASGESRYRQSSDAFRAEVVRAINTRQAASAYLHRDAQAGDAPVLLDEIVPLADALSEKPAGGALVLRENPEDRLFRMIKEIYGSSPSAEALLVRQEGDRILYLNHVRFRDNTALRFTLPLSSVNLPAALAIKGARTIEGTDYRGVEVMAAARPIPGTDWYLIAKIDRDEIFAKVRESILNWLLAIAAIAALSAFGVVKLWRQQRAVATLREQALVTERAAIGKHLDMLSRYANDIILLLDPTSRIVEANDRAVERYGYPRSELIGMLAANLRAPEKRATISVRLDQGLQGLSGIYETMQITRSGEPFPVEVSARAIEVEGKRYFQAIIRDISARKAAEALLRTSEATYRSLFDSMLNGVAYCRMLFENGRATDWVYVDVNKAFETQTGLLGVIGRKVSEVIPGIREADPRLFELYERVVTTGKAEKSEIFVASMQHWYQVFVHRPQPEHFVAVFDIVTERKNAVARIKRLAEAHDALSAVNRAIVRIIDEDELYREICDVIVARAGFRVAWIGMIDRGARIVRPVAQAGDAEEYVSALRIPFDDGRAENRSLIEKAIRTGEPVIVQDIANDSHEALWHEGARRWQLGSMAVIPLQCDGKQVGALNVYAGVAGAFDDEYMKLLIEMGGDLSFALSTIAHNRELRESEARFRAMMEQSVAATYVIQDDKIVYANARMGELFGYRAGDAFDPDPLAHVAPTDRAWVAEEMRRRFDGEPRASYSFLAIRRDGSPFTFGISAQLASYNGRPAIIAIGQDITEKEHAEAERNDRLHRIEAHLAALTTLTGSASLVAGDAEEFARELTAAAASATGVERANVWLFNEEESELDCVDLYEATPGRHSAGAILMQAQFAPEFAALKSTAYIDASEPLTDPRTAGYADAYLKPLRITSMLDAVVRYAGKNLGVLCLEHVDRPHRWHHDEITFACQLADKFALAIINRGRRRAKKKLRRSLEASIEAIAATVEMRDPYTAGHERRVALLAAAIATEMALPPFMVEGIRFGGMIHDLGKIQVPAEILSKPTRISPLEFELIKGHAQAGYEILKGIDFPWPVAEMARQHHERLDGSGYPQGLKGEEILLEARVLAVADTVEAMASHRPYRAGLGIDKALAEIERGRGSGYDPLVADACLRLFRDKGYKLPA